jgi:hypothetical protein
VALTRLPDHAGEVGAVSEKVLDLGDAEDVGVNGVVDEDFRGVGGDGIGVVDIEEDTVKTVRVENWFCVDIVEPTLDGGRSKR